MNLFKRMNGALELRTTRPIFDHVRNYMIGAFVLAIGTTELRNANELYFGFVPGKFEGLGVIVIGVILICINLYDGIYRISKSRYHIGLTLILLLLYLFFSARVVEMAWNFRVFP